MSRVRRVESDGGVIHIVPVIRGLESEVEVVRSAFDEIAPDAVAVSISKEELAGLRELRGDEEFELSSMEMAYADQLSNFGVVRMPPPCFLAALQLCLENEIPIVPLDMNEELYTDTYCEVVGTLDILKESMMAKRVHKVKFSLESPETFVRDWDARINRSRGFRTLQESREEHMARAVMNLTKRFRRAMVVLEVERVEGTISRLESNADNRT